MESISVKEVVEAVGGELLNGKETDRILSVSTNSREISQGALFVPIIGEKADGHDFIDGAFKAGALAVFTSRHKKGNTEFQEGKVYIRVEDTRKALQRLGAFYRKQFAIPVIGVTGSVGKTTTKEMIAAALETKYKVLKTAGNMNSQVGLPLTMFGLDSSHEAAVIEMGMSQEGEMERLCAIACPAVAVMTNIGVSHIGQLGTKENIRKEKLNIINEFAQKGRLYLNGDDSLLAEISQNCDNIKIDEKTALKLKDAEIIFFGTQENARYKAENIKTLEGQTHFTLVTEEKQEEIVLNVLGAHNVLNALVALAVAEQFGICPSVAKKGLARYQPIAMRGQIYEKNGVRIIDDTYNASPDSMKGGVNVLSELSGAKRRIVVLADSMELGSISYQCHYEVGEYIATKPIDEVITVGTEARAIVRALVDKKAGIVTHSYDKNEEVIYYLKGILKEGDAVLVKGSRGMHTDEIVEAIR